MTATAAFRSVNSNLNQSGVKYKAEQGRAHHSEPASSTKEEEEETSFSELFYVQVLQQRLSEPKKTWKKKKDFLSDAVCLIKEVKPQEGRTTQEGGAACSHFKRLNARIRLFCVA